MKNYKPKIKYLEEQHIEALKNLGFLATSFLGDKSINERTTNFHKNYEMCGGVFALRISLDDCYYGDTLYKPYVKIKTPYDSWWGDVWDIKDFTDEVKDFYEKLNNDIGILVGLGIIAEEK